MKPYCMFYYKVRYQHIYLSRDKQPIVFPFISYFKSAVLCEMNYLFIFPLLGLALGQGSPTSLGNLVETLKTSSLQSILVDLIDAAGLTEALSQGGERVFFFKYIFIINFRLLFHIYIT